MAEGGMIRDLSSLIVCALVLALARPAYGAGEGSVHPALPEYFGYGAITRGAESSPTGFEVYHITTLADDGRRGSLRDAVSRPCRYIVFDVAGVIWLRQNLYIANDYLTIDGRTAPAPGITISRKNKFHGVGIYRNKKTGHAHDIILCHLRVIGDYRDGEDTPDNTGTIGIDGEDGAVSRVILDHITSARAHDGAMDIWGTVSDVTVSHCLLYETVKMATFSWSGPEQRRERVSFLYNVFARNNERSVQFRGNNDLVDFSYNIIYRWDYFNKPPAQMPGDGYGLRIRNDQRGKTNACLMYNWFIPAGAPPARAIIYGKQPGPQDDGGAGASRMGRLFLRGNILPKETTDTYSTTTMPELPRRRHIQPEDFAEEVVLKAGMKYPNTHEKELLAQIVQAMCGYTGK